MMRKLSAASLSNPFARRSASTAHLLYTDIEDIDQLSYGDGILDSLISVNCDAPSPSRTEMVRGSPVQRLPIIRDELERMSGNSSDSQEDDETTSNGTVQRVHVADVGAFWDIEKGLSTPSLQSISRDNGYAQQTPASTALSHCSCSMEAGKLYHASESADAARNCLGTPRSSSRWTRVGAINRALLALGSRSFFH
jgi:hypothetical protein